MLQDPNTLKVSLVGDQEQVVLIV